MKKRLIIAAMLLPFACYAQKLVILHTNDTHSHLEVNRENGHGGIIERAAYIESVRAEEGAGNVLLLDAGDISQGTPYFTLAKGKFEDAAIIAMGYDCLTIGNHEFDNGVDALADRYSRYPMPVVCANLDLKGSSLEKYVRPWTIIERGGLKIGIIGLSPHLKGVVEASKCKLTNLDAFEVVNKYAKRLKKVHRCDLVIVLSHMGFGAEERHSAFECDINIAAKTRNVDIIVGGHSHTKLAAEVYVENPDGKKVLVVQDFCHGESVGRIDINY